MLLCIFLFLRDTHGFRFLFRSLHLCNFNTNGNAYSCSNSLILYLHLHRFSGSGHRFANRYVDATIRIIIFICVIFKAIHFYEVVIEKNSDSFHSGATLSLITLVSKTFGLPSTYTLQLTFGMLLPCNENEKKSVSNTKDEGGNNTYVKLLTLCQDPCWFSYCKASTFHYHGFSLQS